MKNITILLSYLILLISVLSITAGEANKIKLIPIKEVDQVQPSTLPTFQLLQDNSKPPKIRRVPSEIFATLLELMASFIWPTESTLSKEEYSFQDSKISPIDDESIESHILLQKDNPKPATIDLDDLMEPQINRYQLIRRKDSSSSEEFSNLDLPSRTSYEENPVTYFQRDLYPKKPSIFLRRKSPKSKGKSLYSGPLPTFSAIRSLSPLKISIDEPQREIEEIDLSNFPDIIIDNSSESDLKDDEQSQNYCASP